MTILNEARWWSLNVAMSSLPLSRKKQIVNLTQTTLNPRANESIERKEQFNNIKPFKYSSNEQDI